MVQLENILIFMVVASGAFFVVNRLAIGENAFSIIDLKYHNHGADGRGLPRNSDGELIHTLDGVRGWY